MNILIVGAGFSGATIAYELAKDGHNVHVIDSRDHIGGNAYDYINENGIRIHKYGPHLLHTSNKKVYKWLLQFGEWVEYKHKVKALLTDGRYVTLPVNKQTKSLVGQDNIISTFYAPYTYKMWGKTIEELDPSIFERVPVRDDDNEYYFPNDTYQMLPRHGYTRVFELMLQGIKVDLNTPFHKDMESSYDHIFNSMAIDQYYDYSLGELPYRSIKFYNVTVPLPKVLPASVVNFTHDGPYTRVTEWKQLPEHGDNKYVSTLTYEEPCDYSENNYERYYPVKDVDGKNRKIYESYKLLEKPNMTFIGRCGMYVYIDMHQAISSAMSTVQKFKDANK